VDGVDKLGQALACRQAGRSVGVAHREGLGLQVIQGFVAQGDLLKKDLVHGETSVKEKRPGRVEAGTLEINYELIYLVTQML
jgi:hypothetical protein